MRKLTAALLLAGIAGAPVAAQAQAASEHTLAAKVSLYSEYEFRGLGQTGENAAFQLNVDYGHSSGLYAGLFVTNISWLQDTAFVNGFSTDADVEVDIFGGYKFEIAKGVTVDLGYLRYEYPSSGGFNPKPNTDELYVGVAYGPFSAKYSYALSDAFGFANSEGSDFIEANIAYPITDKVTLTGHVGHQKFKNSSQFDYTVYKIGAVYDFGSGFTAGAYYKDTDGESSLYTVRNKDWAKGRLVGFVSYTF